VHRLWSPIARGWPSAESIRAFRDRKLASVIRHAAARVPIYRRSFRTAGLDPRTIRTPSDLALVPFVTREELSGAAREDRITEGVAADRLVRRRTSGSTGIPLPIYRARSEERRLGLYRFRALRSMGVRIRDVRIGMEFPGSGRSGLVPQWLQRRGVLPRWKIDCTQPPEAALAAMRKGRADVVGGYAGFLHLLSRMAGPGGLCEVGARLVTSTGEALTGRMRADIQECFGAPILDTYSCLECNLVGYECAETGLYHLLDHSVVVEVLRNDVPARTGERGELVVTTLHSRTSPFIRYRLEDIVTKGPDRCPCGAPFGTIRAIEGRTNDLFTFPDGRIVHSAFLRVAIDEGAPWALHFRIQQESRDLILVLVVPRRTPSEVEIDALLGRLRRTLPDGLELEFRLVPELLPGPSGKHHAVVSRVSSAGEEIDWESFGA